MRIGYRIDIDGTIAEPKHHAPAFWKTAHLYIGDGLVTEAEVIALRTENHQRLWLLPQVLLTHTALPGAVQGVKQLAQSGASLQYFTVRQALDPQTCEQVYEHTRLWLTQAGFPCSREVQFFWDIADKLIKSLEAPEEYIALIDDRPGGLLNAYQRIREDNPTQAEEIRRRVILVAFGSEAIENMPDIEAAPKLLALAGWPQLSELLSLVEEFIQAPSTRNVVSTSKGE
jgi:hypothetical protein